MQSILELMHGKTNEEMRNTFKEIAFIEKKKLDVIKKQLYKTFLKSWDATQFGVMTEARFFSRIHHLKTVEDIEACRKWYQWCQKKRLPFAPIFYKHIMLQPLCTPPDLTKENHDKIVV